MERHKANTIYRNSDSEYGDLIMFMMKKKNFILSLIAALLAGAVISGAVFVFVSSSDQYKMVSNAEYEKLNSMYRKYSKAEMLYQTIDEYYYKEPDREKLTEGMYKGLFNGLDDRYSAYLTAEEYESVVVNSSSEFQGVGITFSTNVLGQLIVISTSDESPAQIAGIKTGDIILMVDDVAYDGSQMDKAASAMRGQKGTKVKLTIYRDGVTKDYELTRANIVKYTVKSEMLGNNIGYIRISGFEDATAEDFEKELRSMEMKGVSGLVIDIRNNGGGLVEQGVKIADMLLEEGVIVYIEDRKGKKEVYNSDADATDIPYVVLVNEGSASTAEILSAAIKDNKGGAIVGTKTFGKGIVQSIVPLEDGDAIKMTTMQYFSPDGHVIHEVGIEPDYVVELNEGDNTDYQLQKALQLLK